MTRASLDVLLIEREPGEGAGHAKSLELAGHRVHRCWSDDDESRSRPCGRIPDHDRRLCTGVTSGACPVAEGVDVALLVRGTVAAEPTAHEAGASCALRAGVPLLEDGPELLDPFAAFLTARANGDTVAACEAAADRGFDAMRDDIAFRTRHVVAAVGIDPSQIHIAFELARQHLRVRLAGPAVSPSVEQALGVRTLDAIRASRRTFGQVDVSYETR